MKPCGHIVKDPGSGMCAEVKESSQGCALWNHHSPLSVVGPQQHGLF